MSYTLEQLRDYDRSDTDAMLDWAADEIERLRAIVDRLADWSKRWNPSTIYPHGMMERCNRELREIETAAREAAEKARG
jgi:hypothetical protein